MTPDAVKALFTRTDCTYLFARWGRPIAPVVFGVADHTVATFKGAIEALCSLSGHQMAETDPELGSNFMVFFVRSWSELRETPDLDRLVPDLNLLVQRLEVARANQYRFFRFDEAGGIKACFSFICMDDVLANLPAQDLALNQVVLAKLLWSDCAFSDASPLGLLAGQAVLKPDIAAVIRAGYDPVLPVAANDPVHALRLAARIGALQ